MCHMKKASLRDLHLKTSAIVKEVAAGEVFVIEKRGTPVAELRPFQGAPRTRRMPNRDRFLAKFPRVPDTGRLLEEDRS